MKNKILLQLCLVVLLAIITIIFFQKYFINIDIMDTTGNKNTDIKNNETMRDASNLIDNFRYIVEGKNGDKYELKSEQAIINLEQPELVFMNSVHGTMSSNNSSETNIFAEKGIFNKTTYETSFDTNVTLFYKDNIIKSDKLDFYFKKNLAIITDNINYKNLNTELQADKIEVDLVTKNTKIFMYNKTEKVKIITIN
tara:strand:- start:83 stop:673 length:591 start_codon:yes stop_codon:yes gene_type:complete